MPFPVIKVDNTNGAASDTAASGAGPSTALSGTGNASTDATGLIVTLPAGTVLTGVATDGSHAIFLNDSTAGARNFGRITASSGSGGATPTVTVDVAFGINLASKDWAIGGTRLSIGGSISTRLFSNNGSSGDAMPGWNEQMQSGHAETLTTTFNMRRAGDQVSGPILLSGAPGAAVMPVITFSNNGNGFNATVTNGPTIQEIEIRNSAALKTASVAITPNNNCKVYKVRITASGANQFWRGISLGVGNCVIGSCEIANCASHAVAGSFSNTRFEDNLFRDNGGDAINLTGTASGSTIEGNIFARNVNGINDARTGTSGSAGNTIARNAIHGNTGAGILISANGTTNTAPFNGLLLENNNITGNGTYGLSLSGSPAQAALDGGLTTIRNNNFGSGATANTSGACSLASAIADPSNLTVDPGYGNPSNNDFSVGANVQGMGFPTVSIGGGLAPASTRSYADIGVAQHQATGGTAAAFIIGG